MPTVCNTTFCAMCARAILDRVSAARSLMKSAGQAGDIEAVHDMRIASRRLRAALALFEPCLPSDARLWRKDVRRITQALGRARDLDVQIVTVESAMKKHPSWQAGLSHIRKGLKSRRRAAQQKIIKAFARTTGSGVFEKIEASLTPMAQALSDNGPGWKQAYRQAEKIILDLLDNLISYQDDLKRPRAASRHHQMRIAAKHLRYSLEVFEPMYGRGIEPALQASKRMQSLLGEMHDCDVWESLLPEFTAGGSAGNAKTDMPDKTVKTLHAFAINRSNHRRKLHNQARLYWHKCKKDRVWPKLRQILRQAPSKTHLPRRQTSGVAKLPVKASRQKPNPPRTS